MIYTNTTEDIPGEGVLGERKLSRVRLGYENIQVCPADGRAPVVGGDCRATVEEKNLSQRTMPSGIQGAMVLGEPAP